MEYEIAEDQILEQTADMKGNDVADIVKTMKNMKNMKMDDGKSVLSTSLETFSMADGKHKKNDIYMDTLDNALTALKQMVDMAIQATIAKNDSKKKKKDEDPARQWRFETAPLKEFNKTLDDVYVSFLLWGAKDADDDDHKGGDDKRFNVSKSFRRLQSYAEWMDSARADLTEAEMQPAKMKNVHEVWQMKSKLLLK